MIVYIDENYKCHVENIGSLTAIKTDFFNGKCKTFIEGFLFVPEGKVWTREDGIVFSGKMITAWKPFAELDAAQREYEQELAEAARILLGGS